MAKGSMGQGCPVVGCRKGSTGPGGTVLFNVKGEPADTNPSPRPSGMWVKGESKTVLRIEGRRVFRKAGRWCVESQLIHVAVGRSLGGVMVWPWDLAAVGWVGGPLRVLQCSRACMCIHKEVYCKELAHATVGAGK